MNSPLNLLTDSILTLPKLDQLDQLATRIHQEHQLCIQSPKTSLIHACNAGAVLIKARTVISATDWGNWLKTQCNLTEQTAQMYMGMAGKYSQVQDYIEQPVLPPKSESWLPSPRLLSESTVVAEAIAPEEIKHLEHSPEAVPQSISLQQSPAPATPEIESVIDVDFTPIQANSQLHSTADLIRFCIPGAVVPKARPRVTSNGTYMPNRYREWRNRAEIELYRQMSQLRSEHKFPLQKAAVAIRFFGNHRTNSDLDNMAGACLDALTLNGAGVLMDDRLSCLPRLTVEYVSGTEETGIWIEIQPL